MYIEQHIWSGGSRNYSVIHGLSDLPLDDMKSDHRRCMVLALPHVHSLALCSRLGAGKLIISASIPEIHMEIDSNHAIHRLNPWFLRGYSPNSYDLILKWYLPTYQEP